jgi:hypothetical protein
MYMNKDRIIDEPHAGQIIENFSWDLPFDQIVAKDHSHRLFSIQLRDRDAAISNPDTIAFNAFNLIDIDNMRLMHLYKQLFW